MLYVCNFPNKNDVYNHIILVMYRDTISTKAMFWSMFLLNPQGLVNSLRSMNQGTIFQGLGTYEHWGRWTIRCHPGGWWVAWMVANHVGKFWGVSGGVCPFAKREWEHDDWWCIIYDVNDVMVCMFFFGSPNDRFLLCKQSQSCVQVIANHNVKNWWNKQDDCYCITVIWTL